MHNSVQGPGQGKNLTEDDAVTEEKAYIKPKFVSERLFARASKTIPGGVNNPVTGCRVIEQTPRFIKRAKGSRIWDADYNEFIDMTCSWGSAFWGHANQDTILSVQQALLDGFAFGSPISEEVDLTELICAMIPSVDKVRLLNSGTEAGMVAIRLARAYTNRKLIVKMDGCYHGHSDSMMIRSGPCHFSNGIPVGSGVPHEVAELTLRVPYNDIEQLTEVFRTHGYDIAAIIIEPVVASMGVIVPRSGYLEEISKLCRQYNSLLIFDEANTGFRLASGGAQELFRVNPDLTILGKAMGGGLPISGVGGRSVIMDLLSPAGDVYQFSTLAGNPISVAAGLTALKKLQENQDIYSKLAIKADCLCEAFEAAAEETGVKLTVNRCGSMFSVFFADGPILNAEQASRADDSKYEIFYRSMSEQGIMIPPTMFRTWYISAAHSATDIIQVSNAIRAGIMSVAQNNI